MVDHAERSAFWQLQFCVFLWGFTAILGRLITLPATALVIWRMALATALIALLPRVWRGLRGLDRRTLRHHAVAGCVIGLHWLAFYGSIKLSNASVAVACLALGSVFAAILEPMVTGRPHDRSELVLGLIALPGVWLLVGGVPLEMRSGIVAGIAAAALSALFGSLNKRNLDPHADPATVTTIQIGLGTIFITVLGVAVFGVETALIPPSASDFAWLLVLVVVCTLLPFMLWLRALHHVSVFTTQLSLNLEPVYAIALAALLFQEYTDLTITFYVGVLIIISTVFIQPKILKR
ncbi:MAG: DMT family transporter [Gammaproteobacteria bacterium]|nr:DMT family transporter [Gammaproteobacteria bacterium]